MKITSLASSVGACKTNYGKHKIPRFIYHLTNKTNYESMLKDGFIKMSLDNLGGDGVFMVELTNFFKRWGNNKAWQNDSLQKKLINHAMQEDSSLVILKIPTGKLNHDLLRVRSQNKLFSWLYSPHCNYVRNEVGQSMKSLPSTSRFNWERLMYERLKEYFSNKEVDKNILHIMEGNCAKNAKSYKQKKEAIEYIYRDNIPMTNVQKIGEIDFKDITGLLLSFDYDAQRPVRSIFVNLLEGNPEVKGAKLLNF